MLFFVQWKISRFIIQVEKYLNFVIVIVGFQLWIILMILNIIKKKKKKLPHQNTKLDEIMYINSD